jgi:hypothetical protein
MQKMICIEGLRHIVEELIQLDKMQIYKLQMFENNKDFSKKIINWGKIIITRKLWILLIVLSFS